MQAIKCYADWLRAAEELLAPLAALMKPGHADLPISGRPSDHDAQADRLESFARPCLLAAHWLQADPSDVHPGLSREQIGQWFREGLVAGTDPGSVHAWGPTANYHQHTVEMAALVVSIEMARPWLWDPLSDAERERIAAWFGTVRGISLHCNNHMFFAVMPLEFLSRVGFGRPGDRPVVDRLLDRLESMSLGGGWFVDGMNEAVDYYNAFGFHYWGLWWSLLHGERDPERAARWGSWASEFLPDYSHFFAASGEHPPFGRSMHYRFAASSPFALALKAGIDTVDPGMARRLCSRNVEFFLRHPVGQAEECLSAGWVDDFRTMAEPYCCPGSPYWAAKAFAPLLLPPDHRFWTAPERPLPAEQGAWARAIAPATLVVRAVGGEVELLNAGTSINASNRRFGTAKYGKFSVRTGVGQLTQTADSVYPPDCALTATFADGAVHGRHTTHAVEVEDDHLACLFSLGEKTGQRNVQVESVIAWQDGWQLHLHQVTCDEPAVMQLGGYALGASEPGKLVYDGDDRFATAANPTHRVAAQPLQGFKRIAVHTTPGPDGQRRHILADHSITLVLEADLPPGTHTLAGLLWVGRHDEDPGRWDTEPSGDRQCVLRHPALNAWIIDFNRGTALQSRLRRRSEDDSGESSHDLPSGFRGMDPVQPVVILRRHLPHWRQDGATYFVTFRLADSLPQARLAELREQHEAWERQHPDASDQERMEHQREQRMNVERSLDQGNGRCVLNRDDAAGVMEDTMRHFDGERYALFASIVMANHVHAVLRPADGHPLDKITDSWKKYSARRINRMVGESGNLWQQESYDHIVRDTEELARIIRYLHENESQTGGRRKVHIARSWTEWVKRIMSW